MTYPIRDKAARPGGFIGAAEQSGQHHQDSGTSRIVQSGGVRYALVPIEPPAEGEVDVVLTVRINRDKRRRDLIRDGFCTCHQGAPCPVCLAWDATIAMATARTSHSWRAAQ